MPFESDLSKALYSEVPAWMFWAVPGAYIVLVGILAFLLCRTWEWIALRLTPVDPDAHWTERARQLIVVHGALPVATLITALLFCLGPLALHGPLTPINQRVLIFLAGSSAFVGAVAGLGRCERLIYGERATLGARWRGIGMSYLLLRSGLVLFLGMLLVIPAELGPGVAVVILVGALVAWGLMRGAQTGLMRRLGIVKPADEKLETMVRDLAAEVGQPVPSCYELSVLPANAAVLPMANSLFVTRPLLEFPPEEVRSILAHEFGHLAEAKSAMRIRMVAFFNIIALPLYIPVANSFGLGAGVLLVVLSFALSMGMQRRLLGMESDADEAAKEHEGEDGTYARALEGIYKHNMIPAVMGTKALTHPHLYDRLEAAGLSPDYPRPAGPPMGRMHAVRFCLILPITALVFASVYSHVSLLDSPWNGQGGEHVGVLLSGGSPWPIFALAELRGREGDLPAAVELAKFAFSKEPDHYMALELAKLHEGSGDRSAALAAIVECRRLDELREPPTMAMDRGLVYSEMGELELAAEELELGRRDITTGEFQDEPWLHVKFSFLARDLQRVEEADEILARARHLARDSDQTSSIEEYISRLFSEREE
jgi:Zn-dependent protease with chaperone function